MKGWEELVLLATWFQWLHWNWWFPFVLSSKMFLLNPTAIFPYVFMAFVVVVVVVVLVVGTMHERTEPSLKIVLFCFLTFLCSFGNRAWKCHRENKFERNYFTVENHFSSLLPAQFSLGTKVLCSQSCRSLWIQLKSGALPEKHQSGWLHFLNSIGQDGTCPNTCCFLLLAAVSYHPESTKIILALWWLFLLWTLDSLTVYFLSRRWMEQVGFECHGYWANLKISGFEGVRMRRVAGLVRGVRS